MTSLNKKSGQSTASMGIRQRRRAAREWLLQVLYARDVSQTEHPIFSEPFGTEIVADPDSKYVQKILQLFLEHEDCINDRIRSANSHWRIDRMDRVDLAILRIGVTELCFTDTPEQIVINEAIELGKRYGSETSFRFINGVLDAIRKTKDAP